MPKAVCCFPSVAVLMRDAVSVQAMNADFASETCSRRCWGHAGAGDGDRFPVRNAVALFQAADVIVDGAFKDAGARQWLPAR